MKRLIIISAIFFVCIAFKINAATSYDYQYGGTELFYSDLAPYGTWIELNDGLVVWRPLNLQPGWAPYKYGHWLWTNDGWYWDSDDPFGYVVFHYGRWYYDDYYGWLWVPDNVWAPSWVEWRYDNDYIGWAPLPPYASFSIDFGIHFSMSFNTPYYRWHFVRYRYMCDPYGYNYYVPDRIKYRIYSITKYRTNYGYSNGRVINRGVDVDFIRKRSGERIAERSIDRVNNPRDIGNGRGGNNDAVRAYIVSRDRASSENLRNMDIKRGTRASSMDMSRIQIGDRNLIGRNNNNREINRNQQIDRGNIDRPNREAVPNNNLRDVRSQPERVAPQPREMQKRNNEQINRELNRAPQINNREQSRTYNRSENFNRNERKVERSQPPRNSAPQVRRSEPVRQAPPVRRENKSNNNNRGEKRDSGNRIRR